MPSGPGENEPLPFTNLAHLLQFPAPATQAITNLAVNRPNDFFWRSVVSKILKTLDYYGGSSACPKLRFFALKPFEKIIVIVLHCTFSF